jgi:hypothetical protein
MIIGHLPAGYLLAKSLAGRLVAAKGSLPAFLCAALLGSVFPDIDLLYFYWIDHRQHHHHTYWTHFPIVWGTLAVASALWMRLRKDRMLPTLAFIFTLNGCAHMMLDSIVGDIWWLAPFVDQSFSLFTITRSYAPWWLNFLLHWSFLLETALLAAAVVVYVRGRQRRAQLVAGS